MYGSYHSAWGVFQTESKLHRDAQGHKSKGSVTNDNLSRDYTTPAGTQMCCGAFLQGGWWSASSGIQATAVTATTVHPPHLHIQVLPCWFTYRCARAGLKQSGMCPNFMDITREKEKEWAKRRRHIIHILWLKRSVRLSCSWLLIAVALCSYRLKYTIIEINERTDLIYHFNILLQINGCIFSDDSELYILHTCINIASQARNIDLYMFAGSD